MTCIFIAGCIVANPSLSELSQFKSDLKTKSFWMSMFMSYDKVQTKLSDESISKSFPEGSYVCKLMPLDLGYGQKTYVDSWLNVTPNQIAMFSIISTTDTYLPDVVLCPILSDCYIKEVKMLVARVLVDGVPSTACWIYKPGTDFIVLTTLDFSPDDEAQEMIDDYNKFAKKYTIYKRSNLAEKYPK